MKIDKTKYILFLLCFIPTLFFSGEEKIFYQPTSTIKRNIISVG